MKDPSFPQPRGPLSDALGGALARAPHRHTFPAVSMSADALHDEDLQLSLYCCYELHYRGFATVNEDWEWEPSLLVFRHQLESVFEQYLRSALPEDRPMSIDQVIRALKEQADNEGFSLSAWLLEHGNRFHAREFAIHRSGYQLKEADPHTWAIPRLSGRAKAAMVEIQSDEYGGGRAAAMHSSLFADAMTALDLDPTYGAYLDHLPAVTLATTNLVSLFGLHRRLRGALVGHLAGFEMNSVGPMGRYSAWLASMGVSAPGREFYDAHVVADEVHQHIALDELVGGFLETEPDQASGVWFGARAVALVEAAFADHVVSTWKDDRSSLWSP
jgi:Iron-containing redox enzyme